ncbi:MAG TPA: hypothetical protein VE465_29145 [Streptosporangiaceae bacterium]|nr:hypothetical protein [Streptosporangiaceae bacterium]
MDARSAAILAGRAAAYGLTAAAIAILANTAIGSCQGRDDGTGTGTGPAAAGAPTGPATTAPVVPGGPAEATTRTPPPGTPPPAAVPPQVSAAELRALAGRWLSAAKSKDYFVFRADGTGAWMVRGRALWQGEVIPTGRGAFRLAWQSTTPRNAAYWHVTLLPGGRKLLFDGTRQEYRKV